MEEKISLNLFFAGLISSTLAIILTVLACYGIFENQINNDLAEMTALVTAVYEESGSDALKHFSGHELRVTHVAADGTVLYDSRAEAVAAENHLDRPEIAEAFEKGDSNQKRVSVTLGQTVYYRAVLMKDGTVLRASMSAEGISDTFKGMFPVVITIFILIIVLAVFFSVTLTKKLVRPVKLLASSAVAGGELEDDAAGERIYPELEPFIKRIRRQQEELSLSLREISGEKQRLEAIITNMNEGLLILDESRKAVLINNSACEFFSLKASGHTGMNVMYISRDTDFNRAIDRAYSGGRTELPMTKNDRDYSITVNAVSEEGSVRGVICLICDVTEKKRADELRSEFTANVSHELKTPLTSISGYAEMIKTGIAKPEDSAAFAEKIYREARRMLVLISDIIRLSELDSGVGEEGREPVELLSCARAAAENVGQPAAQNGVTISVTGCESFIRGDRTLTNEILFNLVDNAVRYNRPGGRVDITVSAGEVVVADTGIGIPQESIPRVFERFYRVDKSRSKQTGGTGLGLAIVRHAAQLQGASVELSSTAGEGTVVRVAWNK